IAKQLGLGNTGLSLFGGYAKIGKVVADDRFSSGPIYTSYVGWANEPTIGTYLGLPALARPYEFGWVGNKLPWSYYEKVSLGIKNTLFNNRLNYSIELYSRNDKDGA